MKQCFTLTLLVLLLGSCTEENSTGSEKKEINAPEDVVEQTDTTNEESVSEIVETPADSTGPLSVLDYMQMIHGSNEAAYGPNQEYLNFQVKDVKNGYLEFAGAYEGFITMVLWRAKDGDDIIAETHFGCGPVCDQTFHIKEYFRGVEKPMEENMLIPNAEIIQVFENKSAMFMQHYADIVDAEIGPSLWYRLPQKGTSITLTMAYDQEEIEAYLAELTWDGERFSVGKVYDEIVPYEK